MLKTNQIAHLFKAKKMRTQVKPHGDESTDFHDREVLKVGSNYTYLAVNMVDSVPKKEEYCYW